MVELVLGSVLVLELAHGKPEPFDTVVLAAVIVVVVAVVEFEVDVEEAFGDVATVLDAL